MTYEEFGKEVKRIRSSNLSKEDQDCLIRDRIKKLFETVRYKGGKWYELARKLESQGWEDKRIIEHLISIGANMDEYREDMKAAVNHMHLETLKLSLRCASKPSDLKED